MGVAACAAYQDERFSEVSLVFFGVGATPVLAKNVASTLEGSAFSKELVAAAQAALAGDIAPDADLYQSAATKLHLARVLAGRAIAALARPREVH